MVFRFLLKAKYFHVMVFNLFYISSHKLTIFIFWSGPLSNFRNHCGPRVKKFAHPWSRPPGRMSDLRGM